MTPATATNAHVFPEAFAILAVIEAQHGKVIRLHRCLECGQLLLVEFERQCGEKHSIKCVCGMEDEVTFF